jgi:DNA-binding transcriptional LysR family regulator
MPTLKDTRQCELIRDRYVVLLRQGHPLASKQLQGTRLLNAMRQLDFVGVRTHADTLRILQVLRMSDRLRLVTDHFTVLPSIVRSTDMAAIMPSVIASTFEGGYSIIEPVLPMQHFSVSLHWSRRFEDDPGNIWFRTLATRLFPDGAAPLKSDR